MPTCFNFFICFPPHVLGGAADHTQAKGKCGIVVGENGDMEATFAKKKLRLLMWFQSEEN